MSARFGTAKARLEITEEDQMHITDRVALFPATAFAIAAHVVSNRQNVSDGSEDGDVHLILFGDFKSVP